MSSKEHIIEVVGKYINTKVVDSAIMINGEWGSGKTFFVKKILCPFIEEELGRKYIYVSLNGISRTDDISKEIFIKRLTSKDVELPNWMKKVKSYGVEVGKVIFDKFSISDDSVDYTSLISLKDYVLVFDDLERSLIEIKELLGYMNRFVEHESVPMIIVANESEIGAGLLIKNQEMKYYLATLDAFDFEKNVDKNELGLKPQDNNEKLNPNKIKKRIDYLFGLDIDYYQIKEKLISKTILYQPNIKEVYKHILDNYEFCEDEKEVLIKNRDSIVSKFINENHNNLRTLQFIFANFFTICIALREFGFVDNEKDTILRSILEYLTALSIKYKKGSVVVPWSEEGEYGQISLSGELWAFDYMLGFAFVNEIVLNSYLDLDRLIFCIEKYVEEQRKNGLTSNDPLNFLSNWWYMNDEEVIALLESVIKNISDNTYQFNVYVKVLSYLITLEGIGFNINIDEVFTMMQKNIRESDSTDIPKFETFGHSVDEKYFDRFNKYINQLNEDIKGRQVDVFKNKINDFLLTTENWSNKFEEYVIEHKNDFLNRNRFFSLIDISDFCNAIIGSNSLDIINIRSAIDSVYNFSNLKDYYSSDLDNIKEILSRVMVIKESKKNEFGLIKTNHLGYFIAQLEKYIVKLS